jgi:Transglycosylase SLT domain
MSKELYQKMAANTAKEFGLPVPMFMALVDHESGWNPNAVSSAGARGLGQVMPANLKRQGIDQAAYDKDPALQLNQAAFFYRDAIRQAKGDPVLGLAFYNASPKAVNRFLEGKASLPTETANYVPTVLWNSQKFGGAPLPNQAMSDVKARFGSRIADRTLVAKTGQQPVQSANYVDPKKDPGLDGLSMADAAVAQTVQTVNDKVMQQAQDQVAQLPAQQQVDVQQVKVPMPDMASTDIKLAGTMPSEFNLSAALGLTPEPAKHGYPDWFQKMVSSEVAAA